MSYHRAGSTEVPNTSVRCTEKSVCHNGFMTFVLLVIVAALLVIAFSEYLGERLGVVTPVILLAVGIGIGSLPHIPPIEVSPDILIEAILPPLLFSAAVHMPTQDFRRNLGAISSLSIALVVVSSLVVGGFYIWY